MAGSPLDVIKQYLVSLGFEVDKSSYDTATKAIDSAGESLAKMAGTTVKQFGLASVAVSSFVTTAVVGMAKFLNDLGNAQIRYEMLARQMWTTQENAQALDTTLKAMGTTLDQLYLSPTLMQQFQELHSQAFTMMPPAEFQQQMAFIQSITFEFKRLKLEGTYALQWIGYYFIKYMAGPIGNIKTTLSEINDIIIKTMPYWTKVVAEVMSWFAQFGVTTVEAIKDIAKVFSDVGHMIPTNIKLIGLAILALAGLATTGPIGLLVGAFVALGLAVNDFFTYLHGGQSQFGPFWQKLINLYNQIKDSSAFKAFEANFQSAMKTASDWLNRATKAVKNFVTNANDMKIVGAIIAGIAAAWATYEGIMAVVSAVTKAVTAAQWLLNAALDANPIGLVALAVGALITAIILLGNKSSDLNGIINGVKDTFQTTFSIIKNLVDGAIGWFSSMWDALNQTGVIQNLGNDFVGLMQSVINVVNAVLSLINQILGLSGTQNVLSDLGGWLTNFVLGTLQTIDTLIQQITSGINSVTDLLQGNWGGAWNNFKNIFTKDTAPMAHSYIYPKTSSSQTNNSNQTNMTVTQNIYGTSDPNATANAASSNISTVLRNQRGAIM